MIQSHSKPAFRNGNRFGIWQLPQLKHHLNPRLHFQIQPQRALGNRTFKAQALRKDTTRHSEEPLFINCRNALIACN